MVVAATGDDKANLVVSLLAKTEYGVPRVVARINHPKNEWMFDEKWGVDVAVSTPRLLSALVEEAVSVGDLVRLLRFSQGDANLVELTLPKDTALVGTTVGEVDWPEDTALVTIIRGGRVLIPTAGGAAGGPGRAAVRGARGPRGGARGAAFAGSGLESTEPATEREDLSGKAPGVHAKARGVSCGPSGCAYGV